VVRYYPFGTATFHLSAMPTDSVSPPSDPPSPCIGVCVINPQTQVCDGCFRALDEIAGWWDYSSDQKHRVLAKVDERLRRIMSGAFFD